MDKEDTDLKTQLSGLETKQLRKRAREGGYVCESTGGGTEI